MKRCTASDNTIICSANASTATSILKACTTASPICNYRFTFSPGAGYYFLKETNTTLAVEAGPGLIVQQLGGVDTTYATLRLAERFEHKLDNGARVWEKAEFLPQVNKLENFLVNAEIGAEAALTKTLSLRSRCRTTSSTSPPLAARTTT